MKQQFKSKILTLIAAGVMATAVCSTMSMSASAASFKTNDGDTYSNGCEVSKTYSRNSFNGFKTSWQSKEIGTLKRKLSNGTEIESGTVLAYYNIDIVGKQKAKTEIQNIVLLNCLYDASVSDSTASVKTSTRTGSIIAKYDDYCVVTKVLQPSKNDTVTYRGVMYW